MEWPQSEGVRSWSIPALIQMCGVREGWGAAWPDPDGEEADPALIPLHGDSLGKVGSYLMELPPLPHCQIFQARGFPVGQMPQFCRLHLGYRPEAEHPCFSPTNK